MTRSFTRATWDVLAANHDSFIVGINSWLSTFDKFWGDFWSNECIINDLGRLSILWNFSRRTSKKVLKTKQIPGAAQWKATDTILYQHPSSFPFVDQGRHSFNCGLLWSARTLLLSKPTARTYLSVSLDHDTHPFVVLLPTQSLQSFRQNSTSRNHFLGSGRSWRIMTNTVKLTTRI